MMSEFYQPATTGLAIIVVCIAAYFDIRWRRIPNWLTIPAIVSGLMLHSICFGWDGLLASFLGGLAGFGFLFIFFVFHLIGGGDVKLLTAIGALLGINLIIPVAFWTSLTGALLAVLFVMWSSYKSQMKSEERPFKEVRMQNSRESTLGSFARQLTVPYGIAIGSGTIFALLVS
jgi:prepilin peptidase CpaA